MHNLATVLDKLNRIEEAETLYLRTLAGKRRILGDAHPSTTITTARLAATYQRLKRYPDAEEQLIHVLQARDASSLPGHVQGSRVDIVGQLVGLYEAWGKPERAAEWRAKLPVVR